MFKQAPTAGDFYILAAVGLLTLVGVFLALAETGLTRMTRIRAIHLAELGRPGARQLRILVEAPARFLNLVLLLVLVVQSLQTALFNTVMSRWFGQGACRSSGR
jgi:Mg2+/Co2+ transporter CorB